MIFELKSLWRVGWKSPFLEERDLGIFSTLSLACKRFKCFEAIWVPREAFKLFLRGDARSVKGVELLHLLFKRFCAAPGSFAFDFGAESRTKKL